MFLGFEALHSNEAVCIESSTVCRMFWKGVCQKRRSADRVCQQAHTEAYTCHLLASFPWAGYLTSLRFFICKRRLVIWMFLSSCEMPCKNASHRISLVNELEPHSLLFIWIFHFSLALLRSSLIFLLTFRDPNGLECYVDVHWGNPKLKCI